MSFICGSDRFCHKNIYRMVIFLSFLFFKASEEFVMVIKYRKSVTIPVTTPCY